MARASSVSSGSDRCACASVRKMFAKVMASTWSKACGFQDSRMRGRRNPAWAGELLGRARLGWFNARS